MIASVHAVGLAARHCTRLLMMDAGRVVAVGAPAQVLTPGNLARCLGVAAHVDTGPGGPMVHLLDRVPVGGPDHSP